METLIHDLGDLDAFCRTVDLGSLTAAAAALGETKGSVSRRVARLEARLGLPLLHRGARGVLPTPEAVAYRERVGQALDLLAAAEDALRDEARAPSGRLRITTAPDVGAIVLAPLVAPFRERYPAVELEVLLTPARLSLAEREADVALRAAIRLDDSALVAHRLQDMAVELVASPAFVARHGAPSAPEALVGLPTLVLNAPGGELELPLAPRGGGPTASVRLRPAVSAGGSTFLREVALGGAGVAVVPEIAATDALADGRLVRVLPDWRVDLPAALWLVHRPGLLPPRVRVFVDFVLAALRPGGPRRERRPAGGA